MWSEFFYNFMLCTEVALIQLVALSGLIKLNMKNSNMNIWTTRAVKPPWTQPPKPQMHLN